jgi:uncharacterized protein (UPF0261 family)
LRKRLREDIEIEEVDCNISEPTFAKKAVDSLFSMIDNLMGPPIAWKGRPL